MVVEYKIAILSVIVFTPQSMLFWFLLESLKYKSLGRNPKSKIFNIKGRLNTRSFILLK
jgi:hypothetical protein